MAPTVNTRTLGNYLASLHASASPATTLVTQDLQVLSTDFFLTGADISKAGQTGQYADLIGAPTIGSAAAQDVSYFALAASGALANTALQPDDVGTAAYANVGDFAVASQGVKADTAVQQVRPGTKITIDNSDPLRPIVSFLGTAVGQVTAPADFTATGTPSATTFLRGDNTWAVPPGASGDVVASVGEGTGIDVNAADPANPIVSIQTGYLATVATTGAYGDLSGRPTLGTAASQASTAFAPSSHVGAGGTAHAAVTTTVAGFMSAADKTKLNGIATGATANAGTVTSVALSLPTGLTVSGSPVTVSGTLTAAWTSGYQGYTTAEATKLSSIAAGATANSTDATLLNRANHTGTQAATTITGLAAVATSGAYSSLTGTPTLGTAAAMNEATVAEVRSATADKVITAELIESAAALVTLTDATSIAVDWDAFFTAQVAVAGNRTFANPTNVQPGTYREIWVRGTDATPRTISFGSNYKGDLPTGTVTSTSWLLIGLKAYSATHITVTSAKAL